MQKKADQNQHNDKYLKEMEEWRSKYLRALADYQNLEKRVAMQREEDVKFAAKSTVLKFLFVLDVLKKAQEVLKDKGLELAVKNFEDVLKSESVEVIQAKDKKFDPYFMECIELVKSDKEDMVMEEIRQGYLMHGKVIRPAQVKVGKRKIDEKAEKEAKEQLQKGDYM